MSRVVDLIVIHCSATPESHAVTTAEITRWHRNRHLRTIGFHYVIERGGNVELGRPLEKVGAHTPGHDANSVGICLVGGANEWDKPEDNFTGSQKKSLKSLVYSLKCLYPEADVVSHRDLPKPLGATPWSCHCPSFDVQEWLELVGLSTQ